MQIGLSEAAPDLLDILSGDKGGSHLQRDEPGGDREREVINIGKKM